MGGFALDLIFCWQQINCDIFKDGNYFIVINNFEFISCLNNQFLNFLRGLCSYVHKEIPDTKESDLLGDFRPCSEVGDKVLFLFLRIIFVRKENN